MKIFIVGAGGQARVVYDILRYDKNIEVVVFVDNIRRSADEKIMGIKVGDHSVIPELSKKGVTGAIIATGDNHIRATHFKKIKDLNFELIKAIHFTTHIAHNAKIGEGTVICAGATIATGVEIGKNVIINTGAIVEHENVVNDHVHIAPGVVLAGRVTIEEKTFIGAGSIVKNYIKIGRNVTIGAGSVVLDDIPENAVAVGTPAKVIKIKKKGNCDE